MKRTATALVALLAVLALASAAGSFDAGSGPALDSPLETPDRAGTPAPVETRQGPTDRDAPAPPDGEEGGGYVGSAPPGTLAGPSDGGISPLFVAGFVVAVVVAAVLAVVLTGDDDRAPRPDDAPDESGDPRPDVTVGYGAPDRNTVVRAWERLVATVGERSSETPGETARRAVAGGVPGEPVARLTDDFEAVRYGDEPPEDRERAARDAVERLDGNDGFGDANGDEDGANGDEDGANDESAVLDGDRDDADGDAADHDGIDGGETL